MMNEICGKLLAQIEEMGAQALGLTTVPLSSHSVLTEEKLIQSYMLLYEVAVDVLDAKFGSQLVVFHPDTKMTLHMRYWLWRRAERGYDTRTSLYVERDMFYGVADIP